MPTGPHRLGPRARLLCPRKTRPSQVYLAAAKVGRIHANNTSPADFMYQNLMVQANIVDASFSQGIKPLLFFGLSCIYPTLTPQPMRNTSCSPVCWNPQTSPTPSPRSLVASCAKATVASMAKVTGGLAQRHAPPTYTARAATPSGKLPRLPGLDLSFPRSQGEPSAQRYHLGHGLAEMGISIR